MVLTTPIPPDDLIFLVAGHHDRDAFAISREIAIRDVLLPRLAQCGIGPGDFDVVFDFGCGCGRLLAGWEHQRHKGIRLLGADINPNMIAFCQQNISFAETVMIGFQPPLPYDVASVDLAYAASVFTHLELEPARLWAAELARIMRPNGTLVITFHGAHYISELRTESPERADEVARDGHHTILQVPSESDTFKGSNSYATYHTIDFIVSLFKDFKLLKHFEGDIYGPTPFTGWQDMAIFQRGDSGFPAMV
jgi:SAM-dependent methyltransferase